MAYVRARENGHPREQESRGRCSARRAEATHRGGNTVRAVSNRCHVLADSGRRLQAQECARLRAQEPRAQM
jgi:hypothetical protein